MSQTELANVAFQALMNEVQRESPSPQGAEYTLNTNLILRKSTALAPTQNAQTRNSRRSPEIHKIAGEMPHFSTGSPRGSTSR
jgi:hypothetical protein